MPTTIVTRAGKGAALTFDELDTNFENLQATADAAIPGKDVTDPTKKIALDLSGITPGATRTLIPPDLDLHLFGRENVLGAVSQTAGVPTGALVEYGSNANGEYWRYAGGMQLCSGSFYASQPITSAEGALFASTTPETWTFPVAFATTPRVYFTAAYYLYSTIFDQSSTYFKVLLISPVTRSDTTHVNLSFMAFGRWY